MFQLYKKRNFSDFVGDTFAFFKTYGKHYYRNYFIINGGFLLVLLVLMYFLGKIFYEGFFSNLSGGVNYGTDNSADIFISNNLPLIIGLGLFAFIAAIFLSILSYAYPVAYLKLVEKKTDFTTQDIITVIKSKVGKIIVFFLASIFIMFPIMAIVMGLSFLLVFIIIGIPLLFIVIPALMCWFSLAFYDYISTDKGYFDALGGGFSLLKQKFWPCVGSTAVNVYDHADCGRFRFHDSIYNWYFLDVHHFGKSRRQSSATTGKHIFLYDNDGRNDGFIAVAEFYFSEFHSGKSGDYVLQHP